ncbi:stalk domain-containing protein [Paenibacillus puerhi]|uniref:stalk domain-containing protein n=1 Tax=Paenibacillus puerhi TaxID=2692622 RepID=UPI001359406E|nr:stalk domain-containing protein [Paenibacillus puerhi]
MKRIRNEWAILLVVSMLLATIGWSPVNAADKEPSISSGTVHVLLYLNKAEAFMNGEQVTLDAPATIINDKMFVPAKFLGDAFGMKVEWNESTRMIEMITPKAQIMLDSDNKSVWINGYWMRFDEAAAIVNGRLMVKLTWLADYMGARYTYSDELRRVEVLYTKTPAGIYIPANDNSKPVAKFSLGKSSYRIGEPIKYIDLSYDPDAEGLVNHKWQGREEVFFAPGTYPVTLTVEDRHGNKSEPYTRYVVVGKETYLNEVEYPIYMKPVGGFIKTNWSVLWGNFYDLPELPKQVTEDTSRKLLVSDSPETFTQQGILYQDTVDGKGRLYADHINGTEQRVTMAILAKNMSSKPITIKTTNKGEVWPSVYANLIGNEATVDFLLGDPLEEKMTIPANQTFVYKQMPDFYPGQGVNLFYDIETDGPVQFSFIAASEINANSLSLPLLPFDGHVRGTFPVSGLDWKVDGTNFDKPSRLVIGDGKTDPFLPGYDTIRKQEVKNDGNYGVVYKIHMDKPRKMAVMILPKGGVFKGPFKINGEMRLVPESGVITAFDGLQIIAKTTGTEDALDIEFSPPAGSAFPIDLIFYPLDERETR